MRKLGDTEVSTVNLAKAEHVKAFNRLEEVTSAEDGAYCLPKVITAGSKNIECLRKARSSYNRLSLKSKKDTQNVSLHANNAFRPFPMIEGLQFSSYRCSDSAIKPLSDDHYAEG